MEDRSSLLKLYNDRTTLLNTAYLTSSKFLDYLHLRSLNISFFLFSFLLKTSSISNTIRPELLIEGILQYIKGKRNNLRESCFLSSLCSIKDSWPYEEFKEYFVKTFENFYDPNEIARILQLVKRFGLDNYDLVPYDYLYKLFRTSKLTKLDLGKNCQLLVSSLKSLISRKIFEKIKNVKKRKALGVISNTSVFVRSEKKIDKSDCLRVRLFVQAFRGFNVRYFDKIKRECFLIVKNPFKFRDPFVHRSVFKVYLRLRNKACEVMSRVLIKWNNLPGELFDFMKDSGNFGFTRENTVRITKKYNLLTANQEYLEKNCQMSGLFLFQILQSLLNRVKKNYIPDFFPPVKKTLKNMIKSFKKSQKNTTQTTFLTYHRNVKLLVFIEKISQTKPKLKNEKLSAKGKKIAARSVLKIFNRAILKKKFIKFKSNTEFPKRKLNRSLGRPLEIELPKRPQGLSRSFIVKSNPVSPKIPTKYEDMKQALNKIKITNGLEVIWRVLIKLKKRSGNPVKSSFIFWKTKPASFCLDIKKISQKPHHSSQFSFRDY